MKLYIQRTNQNVISFPFNRIEGGPDGLLLSPDALALQTTSGGRKRVTPALNLSAAAIALIKSSWPNPTKFSWNNTDPGLISYQNALEPFVEGIFFFKVNTTDFENGVVIPVSVKAVSSYTGVNLFHGEALTSFTAAAMNPIGCKKPSPFIPTPESSGVVPQDFNCQKRWNIDFIGNPNLRKANDYDLAQVLDVLKVSNSSESVNDLLVNTTFAGSRHWPYGEYTEVAPSQPGGNLCTNAKTFDITATPTGTYKRTMLKDVSLLGAADSLFVQSAQSTATFEVEFDSSLLDNVQSADTEVYVMVSFPYPAAQTLFRDLGNIGVAPAVPSVVLAVPGDQTDYLRAIAFPLSQLKVRNFPSGETQFQSPTPAASKRYSIWTPLEQHHDVQMFFSTAGIYSSQPDPLYSSILVI